VSLSGHEDWVTSLAFTQSRHSPPQLTLASGSQDGIIRLWSLDPVASSHSHPAGDAISAFEASFVDFSEGEGGRRLSTKHHVIAIKTVDGRLGQHKHQFLTDLQSIS
jgi:elongator complex protein 2